MHAGPHTSEKTSSRGLEEDLLDETEADDYFPVDMHHKQGFYFYWTREETLNFGDKGLDLPPEKLDGLDSNAIMCGFA